MKTYFLGYWISELDVLIFIRITDHSLIHSFIQIFNSN